MSGKAHYKPVDESHADRFSHYLSEGEKMLYLTGLAHTYLVRKFCIHFLFPGIPLIIATVVGGAIAKVFIVTALLAGYAVAGVVAGILVYIEAKGTQYILTNRRLIMQLGLFNVSLTSAGYDKITHVEVKQGFIEMSLYKFGKVIIHTAGSQKKAIILKHVAHPIHFKNILENLIDKSLHRTKREAEPSKPKWKMAKRRSSKRLLRPIN